MGDKREPVESPAEETGAATFAQRFPSAGAQSGGTSLTRETEIEQLHRESNRIQEKAARAQHTAAVAMIIAALVTGAYTIVTYFVYRATENNTKTTTAIYKASHYPDIRIKFAFGEHGKPGKQFGVRIVNKGNVVVVIKDVIVSAKINSPEVGEDLIDIQTASPGRENRPNQSEFISCKYNRGYRKYFADGQVVYLNAVVFAAPAVEIPGLEKYPPVRPDNPYNLADRSLLRRILHECFRP